LNSQVDRPINADRPINKARIRRRLGRPSRDKT
jgi:hypothetical protein